MSELSAVQFFLRYAISCAYVLKDFGHMSDSDYKMLEDAALNRKDVPTEKLEKLFPAAYRRLKIVAAEHGKDPWDPVIVKRYFPLDHNGFIERGDGTYGTAPKWFCEHCKVKQMKVQEKRMIDGKLFLKVDDRWVQAPFFNYVNTGDSVTVHHSYAVERL